MSTSNAPEPAASNVAGLGVSGTVRPAAENASMPVRARTARSLAAEARFRARVAELGARVAGDWVNVTTAIEVVCAAGHRGQISPINVIHRPAAGVCRACVNQDPEHAAAKFRQAVAARGAVLLDPEWRGSHERYRARCASGHGFFAYPDNIATRKNVCEHCPAARLTRPSAAAAFAARVAELGGVVVGVYVESGEPVEVRCAQGHTCYPRWDHLKKGRSLCPTCGGRTSDQARARFFAALAANGHTAITEYVDSKTPVAVRCASGHESVKIPTNVNHGQSGCRRCLGLTPDDVIPRLRAALAAVGADLIGAYVNYSTPVVIRCASGHEVNLTPSVFLAGSGVCSICSRRNPAWSERRFREIVSSRGGVVLGSWVDANTPIKVRCSRGHMCAPRPAGVTNRGGGICRRCAGKEWDAFYVVANDEAHRVKVGITSGTGIARLATHRASGYCRVIRVFTNLPYGVAPAIERACLVSLARARFRPVLGKEYFSTLDPDVLRIILSTVDSYGLAPALGFAPQLKEDSPAL